jgi:ADP-heptose:LPS heptosyltransferase
MCTPLMRQIKQTNPRCRITFFTDYGDLVRGLPFIDEVRPTNYMPRSVMHLRYEDHLPPDRHIARIFGDQVGVDVTDVRPACVIDADRVAWWRSQWEGRPRPVIVINRRAGPCTPNKDWPEIYWIELLLRLCPMATLVEIGQPDAGLRPIHHAHYVDLRGQTSLPELVTVMASADLHVGPMSGPVHLAAACGVPAVVIYGGYEQPLCSAYPGNVNLSTALPCSPCWLRSPCPHGKECLHRITPADVLRQIHQFVQEKGVPRELGHAVSLELLSPTGKSAEPHAP